MGEFQSLGNSTAVFSPQWKGPEESDFCRPGRVKSIKSCAKQYDASAASAVVY